MKLIDNETNAEERAINRFHELCFSNRIITPELITAMLSSKDLARICARIAKQIQALEQYQLAELEN